MESEKKDCPCNQTSIVKKGFSGQKAIKGFAISFLICCVIIFIVINTEQGEIKMNHEMNDKLHYTEFIDSNYILTNTILISISSIIMFLSLFAGTVNMNDLYSVCPKCGKKTKL